MILFEIKLPFTLNIWLGALLLQILHRNACAYNLDVNNAKVFDDPARLKYDRGNYFGFSTALYTNGNQSAILIGAPRANTSATPSIIEPGTVYQCPITEGCKEWVVDKTPNGWYRKSHNVANQIKDNAWIGSTIVVENKTDPRVVVCAPRWKQNITNRNRGRWYMNGICYWMVADSLKSFDTEATNDIIPLLNPREQVLAYNGEGLFNFGLGQAGFSVQMTSGLPPGDLVIGAPGVFNWQGASVFVSATFANNLRTIVPSIKEERRVQGFSYFGYAVTSGNYFKNGDLWFASGAPRGAQLHGNVFIHSFPAFSNRKISLKKVLRGEQHGEYFGAVLATCDLNGDGKDDLIVGAPQWSKVGDEGRIYVFTARYNENFETQILEGEVINGKFGSAVTCLGDIDYDGYGDIAVGAPYEKETGAIYIFNGNSNGLPKQYSQRISGSEFGQGIQGFGISISEPRDVNGDNYFDIAVGAYLSEKVVLLKSKPVVTVMAKLAYTERKRLLRNTTFFFIDMCTSYDGVYAPESLRIMRVLNVDPMYGRARYGENRSTNNTYMLPDTIRKSKVFCSQLKIQLKKNIQNIIDPIEISASIMLEEDMQSQQTKTKSLYCTSCATINKQHSKMEDIIKLPFAVECGDDNICTSDMGITLSTNLMSDNKYIIGSTTTVKLIASVTNYGEPAYQAKVSLYVPQILSLASFPPECMEGSRMNNTLEVICDVGNPLRTNETLVLELDMSQVGFGIDFVELQANATTQSEDTSLANNMGSLKIYFDLDLDIAIAGKAQEDLFSYFDKEGTAKLSNIRFQHMYEVQKFGVSPIDEAVLTVKVPVYWKHSTGDIEIVNINQTTGYMDGQQFYCNIVNYTETVSNSLLSNYQAYIREQNLTSTEETFNAGETSLTNLPASNRSTYINCTNANVKCQEIECRLGSFKSSLSVAKLTVTFDLQLLNFQPDMLEQKDIIFFISEGNVNITQPHNVTQKMGHKPDNTIVATTFLGSPVTERISNWILILSVLLGIILVILMIMGLIKVGFFNRKKKEELKALKAEENQSQGIILETSSSTDALNQD